jgi:CSLREA domain-containing protein
MKKSLYRYRILLIGVMAAVLGAISADAATLTVNSTADDGAGTCTPSKCTLRDAIVTAHPGDLITFSLPPNSTIALTNGSLSINTSVVITGPGPASLTLTRNTVAGTADFRIFDIPSASVEAHISGLTITNGIDHSFDGGGAIHNAGFLTISDCTVSGSVSTFRGGGISNSGTLVIDSSTIAGNSAPASGGIFNRNSGDLTVTNSTISSNSTTDPGTGAGAGGGIVNLDPAKLTIGNSTISGNTASGAGGIFNASTVAVTITNSTISNNTGRSDGGGGIISFAATTLKLRSTIVAKNTALDSPDISSGSIVVSQGYNLIGSTEGATISATTGDQIGTSASPIDPLLGPLQDNGGPTKTQALLSGSRAIDKGDSGGSVADQRGFARPVDTPSITNAGDGSDIGAYEVQTDQLVGCSEINLVVNNLSDGDAGSLRSIITSACGGSTITFAPNVRGTITLTSGELVLNKNLTINGPGANLLSVERSTAAGIPNFRIFHINGNFNDAISGLTIAKGFLPGNLGGGIANDNGTLTLNYVTVSGNTADIGAGIYTARAATITSSTISGNTVSGNNAGDGGGGIYNIGGTLSLTNSTISGNIAQAIGGGDRGGGIVNNLGTVSLINCTIAGNTADMGGGVMNTNNGTASARNTIIALNTAANGPDLSGTVASNGNNLIGNTSGGLLGPAFINDQVGTASSPIDPLLGPLQNNGGPTATMALAANSPAINKAGTSAPARDQRGLLRPDAPDIGAFELGGFFYPVTLGNISTRAVVGTGDNVMIGGFILNGTGNKLVLLRAIGPSLSSPPFNLANTLRDPRIALFNSSGGMIISNDNWADASNAQSIDPALRPSSGTESAILISLAPGTYTAIVSGANGGTGIGLIEVFDLDATAPSKLINISTRGLVETGDGVMIGGFIVKGPNSDAVVVRAIGPSLGSPPFNIANALQNPTLSLFNDQGARIQFNDDWRSDQQAEIITTGLQPSNDAESAIVTSLPPGNYTAIVNGANGTSGVALVEVYGLN